MSVKTILKLNLFVLVSICILITTSFALAVDYENDSSLTNDNFSNVSPDNQFSTVPINPEFIEYQKKLEENNEEQLNVDEQFSFNTFETDANNQLLPEISNDIQDLQSPEGIIHPTGLIPSPIDLSYLSPVHMEELLTSEEYGDMPSSMSISTLSEELYPSRYDLRDEGTVTEVKFQGTAGSCWAHASLASLESFLLRNNSENWDFSENNLKNKLVIYEMDGFDRLSHDAWGASLPTVAYLARWDGPVAESDDPYNDISPVSSSDLFVAKHVQEVLILPDLNHSDDLFRWTISNYGAITVAMHEDTDFFNKENNTYYCYEEDVERNHAVSLVGWDDDFDRNKFTTAAPGDGAYIIKNSWSDNWGESGYFYISYYDSILGNNGALYSNGPYLMNTVITAENVSNYDHIYQYDPLGWCLNYGYGHTTATGANIFTAGSNEILEAVSFYTVDSNSFYNISIYLNPEDGPINNSGPVTVKNGSIPIAGYHTVDLDTHVSLSAGQNFSVVVTFTTPEYNYPAAVETAIPGYSSNANAERGQSYLSFDRSTWTDISEKGMNICIKAFKKEDKEPEAGFVADKRYVHINEPVSFHDTSLFSPDTWQWDFGDNSASTVQNPSHSYTSTGLYNVSLNVSNEFGNNTTKRNSFIHVLNSTLTVNESGTADFTTIRDALTVASEGDTIIVESGIYSEQLRIAKDNITLRSSTGNPADVRIISSNPDYTDKQNYAVYVMADNITFQGVTVSGAYRGIYFYYSNECNIVDSIISDCYYGIRLSNSNLCNISNSSVSTCYNGIRLSDSEDCGIIDCITDNNLYTGLYIDDSFNNNILNCTIEDNTGYGLQLWYSENNNFANNSISGSIYNCLLYSHYNVIDTSNTVEGKPIYYLSGVSDMVIDKDSNAGLVHLNDCSNITVKDITIQNNFYGIYFYNTTSSTIANCTLSTNADAIYFFASHNNTIYNSTLANSNYYGISLSESNDNLIYSNYLNNSDNFKISGTLHNQWNIPKTPGTNIIGGDYIGGNYWAKPNGTGWSQINPSTGDGFCQPYNLSTDGCNIDYLPLTANAELSSSNENTGTVDIDDDGVRIRRNNDKLPESNIVLKESDMQFVGRGTEVKYEFIDVDSPVTRIRFEAKTTEGYVVADVYRLKSFSAGLSGKPSGKVYQNLEITVGDEKLGLSDFMEEAIIGFSVPIEWIESNDIDADTIRLEHYSDNRWDKLLTTKVGEDIDRMHFESRTTSFSPFAICADTTSISDETSTGISLTGGASSEKISDNEDENPSGIQSKDNYRLLQLFVFILLALSILVYYRHKK
ncbi:lectin like domain-containing protein [Methanolobus halotolerans]|uniref:PKD domain-containing protein n=1 Tax=Methanolobus halotolerans TaxID=2052935 RepID=A0A4E0Q536_9EURY|nr:lectin like domain-containing protein [Methanolobus halotolerans]TGC09155.1 hypothetical protein CUN85_07240 [Methanolobus halotolerans]